MAELKTGRFKAKAILSSVQWGEADNDAGTLQISVDMFIKELDRSATTFLYMSPSAKPYSIDRLRTLGWKGKTDDDLADMTGIEDNEVDVEITSEQYQGKTQFRLQILTGPGNVKMAKPLDPKSFVARVKALSGTSGGGGSAEKPKAPF